MSIFNSKKDSKAAEAEPAVQETAPSDDQIEPEAAALEAISSEEVAEELKPKVATTCNTANHLMAYPLIKETVNFVDSIPGVKAVKGTTASIADPTIGFVFKQPIIKPVIETCDSFADQTLSTIDSNIPCLQNTSYSSIGHAIQKPFVETKNIISNATQATCDTIDNHIFLPAKNSVHDFRAYYNKNIYDTQGKPLLRSSLDPVFRPINGAIDDFTTKNYKKTETSFSHDFSSEIERNIWLSLRLAKCTVPVIHNKVTEVVMIPCNYSQHALDVFKENLEKQEKKRIANSITATYNSSIDLAGEAWASTVDVWNHVFGSKKEKPQAKEPVQGIDTTNKEQPVEAHQDQNLSIEAN